MTTTPDGSARARLDTAFAAEERRGLMLASAARSAASLVVVAWLAVVNPERGPAYAWVVSTAALFLVTGLAQLWLYWRALVPPAAPYVLMQMAFSFRPRLLLWSTLCGIAAWAMGFAWVLGRPGIVTDPRGADQGERLVRYFLPNGLKPQGPHVLRGRETPIVLWTA